MSLKGMIGCTLSPFLTSCQTVDSSMQFRRKSDLCWLVINDSSCGWSCNTAAHVLRNEITSSKGVCQATIDPASARRSRKVGVVELHQFKKSGQVRWHQGQKHHRWQPVRPWQADQSQTRKQRWLAVREA